MTLIYTGLTLRDAKIGFELSITPEHQKFQGHHKVELEGYLVATRRKNGTQRMPVVAYDKGDTDQLRMCTRGTTVW